MTTPTPLTNTYKSWALLKDDAFISAEGGRVWLFGARVYAEQYTILYPGSRVVNVEVTVRTV